MILGQREVPLGTRLPRVCVLYALFLLISFFGWLLEVLFFFFLGHGFTDRGFLSLPLCTVYGVGVIAIDLLLGCNALHAPDFCVDKFLHAQTTSLAAYQESIRPYLLY